MGKVVAILGACLVVAGGGAYGLYTYSNPSDEAVDPSTCPVVHKKCCGGPDEACPFSADPEPTGAMAVAGPAALFGTSPVHAEVGGCCEAATGCRGPEAAATSLAK